MNKRTKKKLENKIKLGIEEAILIFLITIELLDFIRMIPPVLEFVEKTVAIIAIGYLFYKASLSRIFFGHKNKTIDSGIIISYLLLSSKTILGFFITAAEEQSILSSFYHFTISNIDLIEKICFKSGILILAILAIILIKQKIKTPSLMHIIHEERPTKTFPQKLIRFTTIYLSMLTFFFLVFTLAIEWLATTVDAPILVLVLLIFLYIVIKYKKHTNTESFLHKVSDSAEEFYEKVILMFQKKNKI